MNRYRRGWRDSYKILKSGLDQQERKCCVMRKELLAIVAAVPRFHLPQYLYVKCLLIITDEGTSQWLLNVRNAKGQTARCLEKLAM